MMNFEMIHNATFWLSVSMLLFIAVAGKPVSQAVVALLDKRRDAVRTELAAAAKLRSEAEELMAYTKRQQEAATVDAERIVREAQEDAARLRADAAEKLGKLLAAREQAALAKIAEAEALAVRDARALASTLALKVSRDVLVEKLVGSTADALVDSAIAELPETLAR